MIKYALKCGEGHRFESWFASAAAYDTLHAAGHVACVVCGSANVEKAIMAPQVQSKGRKDQPTAPTPAPLTEPSNPAETALRQLRRKIEADSDYVGTSFAKEARAIHDGTSPARAIYGEAKPAEARKLIEDGVPVAPLPFVPERKTN